MYSHRIQYVSLSQWVCAIITNYKIDYKIFHVHFNNTFNSLTTNKIWYIFYTRCHKKICTRAKFSCVVAVVEKKKNLLFFMAFNLDVCCLISWVFKIFKHKLSTFHKGSRDTNIHTKNGGLFVFVKCSAELNSTVYIRYIYMFFKCSIFIGFGCIPVSDNLFISDEVWFFVLTVLFLIKQVIQSTCVLCTYILVKM